MPLIILAIAAFLFWLLFIDGMLWKVVVGAVAWVGIFGFFQFIVGPAASAVISTIFVFLAIGD